MIKVAALTSGRSVPSARFRIRQHIAPLKKAGIYVREFVPAINKYSPSLPFFNMGNKMGPIPVRVGWKLAKLLVRVPGVMGSWTAGITWLERELYPGILTLEPFLKRPVVLDVDDAIWLTPPFGRATAIKLGKLADVVLAGNHHIAKWFGAYARDVRVVPTSVDTIRIRPRKIEDGERSQRRFTVGWTGTSSNYPSLYRIEEALLNFLRNHHAELLIIADKAPQFSNLNKEQFRFVKWDTDREISALGDMDVGLMPLPFDDWSLGKCSFKMLQYMAAGLPVVVSPVGMNVEILSMGDIGFPAVTQGDWYDALHILYHDSAIARRYGANGRLLVEDHFSQRVVSKILVDVFRELASHPSSEPSGS